MFARCLRGASDGSDEDHECECILHSDAQRHGCASSKSAPLLRVGRASANSSRLLGLMLRVDWQLTAEFLCRSISIAPQGGLQLRFEKGIESIGLAHRSFRSLCI